MWTDGFIITTFGIYTLGLVQGEVASKAGHRQMSLRCGDKFRHISRNVMHTLAYMLIQNPTHSIAMLKTV
jgi:hypothetical protein